MSSNTVPHPCVKQIPGVLADVPPSLVTPYRFPANQKTRLPICEAPSVPYPKLWSTVFCQVPLEKESSQHFSGSVRTAFVSRTVKIAGTVRDQCTLGVSPVLRSRKAVQDLGLHRHGLRWIEHASGERRRVAYTPACASDHEGIGANRRRAVCRNCHGLTTTLRCVDRERIWSHSHPGILSCYCDCHHACPRGNPKDRDINLKRATRCHQGRAWNRLDSKHRLRRGWHLTAFATSARRKRQRHRKSDSRKRTSDHPHWQRNYTISFHSHLSASL